MHHPTDRIAHTTAFVSLEDLLHDMIQFEHTYPSVLCFSEKINQMLHVCECLYICISRYVCIYVSMYVCMHACVFMYMYI